MLIILFIFGDFLQLDWFKCTINYCSLVYFLTENLHTHTKEVVDFLKVMFDWQNHSHLYTRSLLSKLIYFLNKSCFRNTTVACSLRKKVEVKVRDKEISKYGNWQGHLPLEAIWYSFLWILTHIPLKLMVFIPGTDKKFTLSFDSWSECESVQSLLQETLDWTVQCQKKKC